LVEPLLLIVGGSLNILRLLLTTLEFVPPVRVRELVAPQRPLSFFAMVLVTLQNII
jgi:hypothetical protein